MKKPTKTAFVLSLDPRMPAAEVVARAKKRGFKLTAPHVHVIRSNAKRKAGKSARVRSSPRKTSHSAEAALRSAIAELGLARSRIVLAEVERAFG